MNSVERVIYYTENIPQEAPRTSEELEEKARAHPNSNPSDPSVFAVLANGGKAERVDTDWPNQGNIALNSLKMKYRKDTPLVIKGLDVTIKGGERVGVGKLLYILET